MRLPDYYKKLYKWFWNIKSDIYQSRFKDKLPKSYPTFVFINIFMIIFIAPLLIWRIVRIFGDGYTNYDDEPLFPLIMWLIIGFGFMILYAIYLLLEPYILIILGSIILIVLSVFVIKILIKNEFIIKFYNFIFKKIKYE